MATTQDSTTVDVLELVASGDRRKAIAVLMDEHGDAVFNFCSRVLRDRALAEDVLQRVFIDAYRDIAGFQGRASFRTWLIRIAGHRCLDAIKSSKRRRIVEMSGLQAVADMVDPAPSPAERLDQSRLIAALESCLQILSAEVRMTVLLRFRMGLSYEELSVTLDARPGALQARVARALPALKDCLEDKGWAR